MGFKLKIAKDRIKFSAAHFTIFSKDKAERLHGHNYYVSIEVHTETVDELGFAISMETVKQQSYALSQQLDEYVLIPENNPYLQQEINGSQVNVKWKDKSYSFPKQDVKILPVSNITCENLALWFWQNLSTNLPQYLNSQLKYLEVSVKETYGQEASYGENLS